eukprot:gene13589-13714_t
MGPVSGKEVSWLRLYLTAGQGSVGILTKMSGKTCTGSHSNVTCLQSTHHHCSFSFDVLIAHLSGLEGPEPDFEDGNCPLFVTWNKISSSGRSQLRGCIGTLEPRRLHTALKDYALTSALRDTRFPPVQQHEVAQLSCSVSLLSCFEEAANWQDWEIGTHGLIIEFTDPLLQCKRTATFLPEVAADQGWTRRQCIESLIRKAGYTGAPSQALLDSLWITRYQSSKSALSFTDYIGSRFSRLPDIDSLLQQGRNGSSKLSRLMFS